MENTFILKGYRKTVLVLEPDKSGGFLASFPGEATSPKGVLYLFTDEKNFSRIPTDGRGKGDVGKIVAAALEEDGALTLTASHAKDFSWTRAKAHLRLSQPAAQKEFASPAPVAEEQSASLILSQPTSEQEEASLVADAPFVEENELSSLERAADAYVQFITQDMPLADAAQTSSLFSPATASAEPVLQAPYDFLSPSSPLTGSFYQPQEFIAPPEASSQETAGPWPGSFSVWDENPSSESETQDFSHTPKFPLEEEAPAFSIEELDSDAPEVVLDADVPPAFGQDACPLRPDVSLLCPFPQTFPESHWRKVHFPHSSDGNHYLVGEIYHQGQLAATAVAVPGHYAPSPPPWLKGFTLYLKAHAGAEGYWLSIREV